MLKKTNIVIPFCAGPPALFFIHLPGFHRVKISVHSNYLTPIVISIKTIILLWTSFVIQIKISALSLHFGENGYFMFIFREVGYENFQQ
ncbi:hypothetical protein CI104_23000 [Citrobacter farmeri]|uniref:Uncharacterized protein n=1 Tax=Citrobacter farmeri TaxID=67824 RepID=A0ACA8DCA2_9ENTR|nr:hypothetical protein CI104_23000 [Citrobacter farmeri]